MAEPDFLISVPLAFFEETFKYERRRPEDFVGRPDDSMWTNKENIKNEIEEDENCTPTQSQIVGKKSRTWSIAAGMFGSLSCLVIAWVLWWLDQDQG